MFVLKSTYDAAIAAKDAEIAGLMKRIDTLVEFGKSDQRRIRELKDRCADLWQKAHDAEAKLARFTEPRERGEGGRFLPLKRVS